MKDDSIDRALQEKPDLEPKSRPTSFAKEYKDPESMLQMLKIVVTLSTK